MSSYEDMLAGTADGAMMIDANGRVVFWNKAAEQLLGFSADEVLGCPCHEVFRGKTRDGRDFCSPSCPILALIKRCEPVADFDVQAPTKADATHTIWLNVSTLPLPDGQGRIHMFRDISSLDRARRMVQRLQSALREAEHPAPGNEADPVDDDPPPQLVAGLELTEREQEILNLLHQGLNTDGIAGRLRISPATVRNHVQHILNKLGAHSRIQAVAIAFPEDGRA